MDDKLNNALKDIYNSLSDEQKKKAKQCRTMSELNELAAKEGIELPDEVLDEVAGGCGDCGSDSKCNKAPAISFQ